MYKLYKYVHLSITYIHHSAVFGFSITKVVCDFSPRGIGHWIHRPAHPPVGS